MQSRVISWVLQNFQKKNPYMTKNRILTLKGPTPQNGQSHSNRTIRRQQQRFVGMVLKGLTGNTAYVVLESQMVLLTNPI